MSWTKSSEGEVNYANAHVNDAYDVLTETVTLGAAKANRYSSVFTVPPGVGFTIISNTAATNLSGSAADQLYVSYDGTNFYQKLAHLRDGNYKDKTAAGVAIGSVDNASRIRFVDPNYVGQAAYYKIRILQAAVESSAKTVGLAVIIGGKTTPIYQ